MRRWDVLVDRYIQTCESRGLTQGTVKSRASELSRFGQWLKKRRPRPRLDQVDSDLVVRYISDRSAFRSRSTVSSVFSHLRGMGEFLVQESVWPQNPLRWIRGPKIDHWRRLPKRIDQEHLKALWDAAQGRRQEHARYQAVCVLAILYGNVILELM